MIFGLTGGIASGKSTVAAMMRARGVAIIDADLVARDVVEPGTQGLREIVAAFGSEVLTLDGGLDRKVLGAKVFADQGARARLNAITHPLIRAASMNRAAQFAAEGAGLIAYEAALLVETGNADAFRPLVVVAAPEAVQVARIVARDRLTEAEAKARIAAQMPLADKIALADYVIDTSGTPDDVRDRTDEVLRELRALASPRAG